MLALVPLLVVIVMLFIINRPRCPVLYLYGERKPLMFHSQRWLGIVEESGGRAVGVTGAGHWLQESHAEAVNGELAAWFR